MLQTRNAANETADGCTRNFAAADGACCAMKRIRMIAAMYVSSADLLSVRKNFAWWAVARRTLPSKLGACAGQYGKFFCSDDMQQICKTLTPQQWKGCELEALIGNVGSVIHFPQSSCGKVPPKSTEEKLIMTP